MTAKDLIESGIIELYCLGIASEEEQLLVEQLSVHDELLMEEIASVNNALAAYAVAVSTVLPSQRLKEKILSSIQLSAVVESGVMNLPPLLTPQSQPDEWLKYLTDQEIVCPADQHDLLMIELPGTEDYYTYAVFGKPGDMVDEEMHTGCDEYLLICSGSCEMTIAGIKISYKAGDFLTITPGKAHSAKVTGTERMIVIGQRRAA
ncbi:MAG: cupin domain-containing protein [Chitinophagales bacterium]